MSLFGEVWGGVKDGVKELGGIWKDYRQEQIQETQFQTQNSLAILNANTQMSVAQIQAAAAIRQAENGGGVLSGLGFSGFNSQDPNLSTTMQNMQTVSNKSNNLMTYLTLFGIGLAVLQYMRK